MSVAVNIGRRAVNTAHGIVEIALLAVVLLLLAMGFYALWDSNRVYQAADSTQYGMYKPSPDNDGLSFAQLQAINPDVFAWLTVYGTNIDYPVVQGPDNLKYVNTNAKGRYSLSGAIFLDTDCNKHFSDFSSIIHAHHMEKDVMFGEIGHFSTKSYFDAREYGVLYFDGQDHGIQFFAFLHANAYDTSIFRTKIVKAEEQEAYLKLLLERATQTRDVAVSTNDRIVLLVTCSQSSTDGRYILVGRITDELYDDPFFDNTERLRIDSLSGLWQQAPFWGKTIALSGLAVLLLWLIPMLLRKRRSQKKAVKTVPPRGDEDTWQ